MEFKKLKEMKQILKIIGIILLILVLGLLLFKINYLENQEPQEKIIYVNQTLNYSDEELKGEIANLKITISNLEKQLNETNSTLWNFTHPPKEKSKDSTKIIVNEGLEIPQVNSTLEIN